MRIAVVYSGVAGAGWSSFKTGGEPKQVCLSHGLSVLSSKLKQAGHQPFLVDMRSFPNAYVFGDTMKRQEYDVAFLWVMPGDYMIGRKLCKLLKEAQPDKIIVAAGPAVSMSREDYREHGANIVLLGEPDGALLDALERKLDSIVLEPWKEPVALDDLPDYDHGHFNTEFQKQTTFLQLMPPSCYTVSVARRCPLCYDATLFGLWRGCKHCHGQKRTRVRSPQNVIDELYRMAGSHGAEIGSLFFHDTHLADVDWLRVLAQDWQDTIRPIRMFMPLDPRVVLADPDLIRRLTLLGLRWVGLDIGSAASSERRMLGIETSVSEDASALSVLKRNRVNAWVHVVAGLPRQSTTEIDQTERFIREAWAAKISYSFYIPMPGDPIWDSAMADKLIDDNPHALFPDTAWIRGVDHSAIKTRFDMWHAAYSVVPYDLPFEVTKADTAPVVQAAKPIPAAPVGPPASISVPPPAIRPVDNAADPRSVRAQIDRLLREKQDSWPSPKVSVIICSYNRPDMIREAFLSVERQTMSDWECIFVDDCSVHPGVHEFLDYKEKSFEGRHKVRVIRHPRNVNNIAVSWNEALEIARGEYVCLLDDDNKKHPEFMATLAKVLDENPTYGGAYCRSSVISKHGESSGTRGRAGAFTLEKELEGNFVDSGELMFRRSLIDKIGWFDENMKACEDWDWVCRITAWGGGLKFVDRILTEYRAHDGNRLQQSSQLGAAACTERLRSKHKPSGQPNLLRLALAVPKDDKLTASQRQVIGNIKDALYKIDWVGFDPNKSPGDYTNTDLVLIAAPFMLDGTELDTIYAAAKRDGARTAVIHMEDPQAIHGNSRSLLKADWIVANDYAAMRWYTEQLKKLGDEKRARQVLCWNSLGLGSTKVQSLWREWPERRYDVTILGFPYPTRAQIMRDFLKAAPSNWRVAAVGDGWKRHLPGYVGKRVECFETLNEEDTIRQLCDSKVVLLTHRRQTDIGGFPVVQPESIHRGFMEAACGCEVVVDDVRIFGAGKLRFHFYKEGKDAASVAWSILNGKTSRSEKNASIAQQECTHVHRLRTVLNHIRSERFLTVIP